MNSESQDVQDLLHFTQFAVDHCTDAAYWVREDASLLYVNEAACTMLGYSREELLAKRIYELNPDIPPGGWSQVWEQLKAAGQRTFEGRHVAKDGRVIPIEVSANLLVFNGEEFSCAFTRDITERKSFEQRLRQAEKMDAIGRLAGGVAHDFNNQLAGILGYADVLEMEVGEEPSQLELVQGIQRLVEHAAGLTSQLLAFARKGKYQPVSVELHQLVEEVAAILARSIDKRIAIRQECLATESVVVGDPAQLQAAILNLALNARDAMSRGGQLSFETQNVSLGQEECDSFSCPVAPGAYVRLSVSDNGEGMPPDVLKRVFEPFYTTKEQGKGTGLGLAAAYGTVVNHRGAIRLESKSQRGTRADVYLPIAQEQSATKPATSPAPVARPVENVLIVDDEESVREVTKRFLKAHGGGAVAFGNGKDALSYYRANHQSVDLVVLDMCMPDMGGRETYDAMRKINPDVKVLLASGYSLDEEAQLMLEDGVRGFIQKPFRGHELAAEMQRCLRSPNT